MGTSMINESQSTVLLSFFTKAMGAAAPIAPNLTISLFVVGNLLHLRLNLLSIITPMNVQ